MSNPRIAFELAREMEPLPLFRGTPIVAHIVVNVESWIFDAPMPRKLLGSPHGRDHVPDVPNFSWAEYGMRVGLSRILDALEARSLPATVAMNSSVIEHYPAAAAAIGTAGWEIMGHGVTQRALPDHDDQHAVIDEALSALEAYYGSRPRGWLGAGLQEGFDTPDHLSGAGVDYICDWFVDDVPVWLDATPRRLVAVPYTLELNDSVLYAVQEHEAEEYERRVLATLSRFRRESVHAPRVITLPLHPHLIAVPHRIDVLERVLDALVEASDVTFAYGAEICDWFLESKGAASAT